MGRFVRACRRHFVYAGIFSLFINVLSLTVSLYMLQVFDRVLVAVGRQPNSQGLGLERTRVRLDEQGFVVVDEHHAAFVTGDVAMQKIVRHAGEQVHDR